MTTGTAQGGATSGVTTAVTGVGGHTTVTSTGTTTVATSSGSTSVTTSGTSTSVTATTVTSGVTTSGVGGMGPATVTTVTVGPSTTTSGVGGGTLCPHGVCTEGPPLDPNCGMCEATVCQQDGFCCQAWWDSICVQEANQFCNANCPFCPHDMCTTGAPLTPSCDPCVAQVCMQNPNCCSQSWGGGCIQLVGTVCNIACP